jgi:trans-2,3-dihydro-3-hydroxyanthranilate isomerase
VHGPPSARAGAAGEFRPAAIAVGLEPEAIGFDRHVPSCFSAGIPFTFVPVASAEAMARAQVRPTFEAAIGPAALLYSRAVAHRGSAFHARVFAPGYGVAEDPATGSAVAAFAGAVMQFEDLFDGEHGLVVEQGFEMGRPSFVTLSLEVAQGALVAASIGGAAVIVTQGILDL